MFEERKLFTGLKNDCQRDSVPKLLLTLVNMILEGPSIKDQKEYSMSSAALSIAQLLKFNSVKHSRLGESTKSSNIRHSTAQETPLPMYIGLVVHAHTRKRDLIDRLSNVGVSITYDRILRLSAQLGEAAIQQFNREQVVCPSKLRGGVFTTAAVDNIDHNPSSTTSKASFHGTGISLFQHPTFPGQGVDRSIEISGGSASQKTVGKLPNYYTDIQPVQSSTIKTSIPPSTLESLCREKSNQHIRKEYCWLEHVQKTLKCASEDEQNQNVDNMSWASYHASHQTTVSEVICQNALLPLFHENAHTVAMIKHSMDVVKKAVQNLNDKQTPVVAFDQPLYAIAKQIQWRWPSMYGEEKCVVMFGGLHIEMAALKTLGDWLQGSGWVEALIQAGIATAGTANSFLHCAHVTRSRYAHQVTVAALYILQNRAYNNRNTESKDSFLGFDEWCSKRVEKYPQFQYWATVMALEISLLVYVRSLRESSFTSYIDALTELVPWFFALDHTNYARWIPVHLRDMSELPTKHPDVAREFEAGNFTIRKTKRAFSAIAIDQAHEQNNAYIKGDGGVVGLTDNPSALRRWMVAGPEVTSLIGDFENSNQFTHTTQEKRLHHDQTASVQKTFKKDVCSLVSAIEDLGNPFEEDTEDLLVLHSKEIAGSSAVETVRKVLKIGEQQFRAFSEERLIKRTKSIWDPIRRNKFKVFVHSAEKIAGKKRQQVISLKSDIALFSRLYISCQTRGGNLEEFFKHENQAWPPALSVGGKLRFGKKSDLLTCFEDLSPIPTNIPNYTCIILDGAAVIQMLKPMGVKTFDEYALHVFLPYISSQLSGVSRLDIIWDTYKQDSLKGTARSKRGKGVRRHVVGKACLPGNWQSFLRLDSNKTELFSFLSSVLLKELCDANKKIVVTDGEMIRYTQILQNMHTLSPCSHEEADTRILLHVSHAAQHGHQQIIIRTVDTDVVVLSVYAMNKLPSGTELWLAFGTGKSFHYLAAHEIAASLGLERACALPMFHALTGCDTVSSFAGHGKKAAWSTWKSLPEMTDALLMLQEAPIEVPENAITIIERFVVLLFDKTSTCTKVDNARKKLFPRKSLLERIPPTQAALMQHIRRAVYQGGHIWGNMLVPEPVIPSPSDWGWVKTGDSYEPYWTTLPQASKSCQELLSCGCKRSCQKNCKCKNAALQCTGLCFCGGECDI